MKGCRLPFCVALRSLALLQAWCESGADGASVPLYTLLGGLGGTALVLMSPVASSPAR